MEMIDARIPDHCGWAARGHWRKAYKALLEDHQALRERAEAAERDRDEALNQLDSAKHSVDVLCRRITTTNAAWNDAIEAAEREAWAVWRALPMARGVDDAARAIRALRRAAPTEGEA